MRTTPHNAVLCAGVQAPVGRYSSMFYNCSKVKVSETKTGTYTKEYPFNVTNSYPPSGALNYIFNGTGGTFTGNAKVNTTYYLDESNTIV